ncbi:MerR family transcriptional regulator [Sedimentitalea sp. JM2-8]|uniref:MerR family transcriptional regulator n=1 Tax=Sedimentitalea xiamensis TaxID=3050037 RepID=A0ABT7FDA6_9RHOB|nr:MerR family transcriptional regulator [Sedimentitalea xiamensis]MDK3073104.1 MerR family transcriptional regulator [Sedimentitalea xiamensis]
MSKSPDAFRTISEVADWLGIQAHVLRFWESKFSQVKPVKRAGGRRYYRPGDMQLLGGIKKLLHDDGVTIKGVQKILREQGVAHVAELSQPLEDGMETLAQRPEKESTVLQFRGNRTAEDHGGKAIVLEAEMEDDSDDDQDDTGDDAEDVQGLIDAALRSDVPEADDDDDDDDDEQHVETLTAATAERPEPPPPQAKLPSFMHRDRPGAMDMSAATIAPDQLAPKAQAIEVSDPPDESDIPYHPGVLAHLARLDRLTSRQVQALTPISMDLRKWLDRNAGAGSA